MLQIVCSDTWAEEDRCCELPASVGGQVPQGLGWGGGAGRPGHCGARGDLGRLPEGGGFWERLGGPGDKAGWSWPKPSTQGPTPFLCLPHVPCRAWPCQGPRGSERGFLPWGVCWAAWGQPPGSGPHPFPPASQVSDKIWERVHLTMGLLSSRRTERPALPSLPPAPAPRRYLGPRDPKGLR